MAHHRLLQLIICISDGRLEESAGSLRSGFVTSSLREQVPGGPSVPKPERRADSWRGSRYQEPACFKNKLLKCGKGGYKLSFHTFPCRQGE